MIWAIILHIFRGTIYPKKTISLDINDLYVNLPVQNILNITKFCLKANNPNQAIIEDILRLL